MDEKKTLVRLPTAQCPALQVSAADFLKQNTPLRVMQECLEIKTPLAAAKRLDIPSLVSIRKEYGDKFVVGYLKLWIVNIIEYLGATQMSDVQLEETAILLLGDNYFLNLADLNVVMGAVKRGERTLATPINGAKLSKLFADYRADRCTAYEDSQNNEHDVLKKHGYIPHTNDIAQATLDAMIENQMAAAERQALAEQERLSRQYHALRNQLKVKSLIEKHQQNTNGNVNAPKHNETCDAGQEDS